MSNTMLLRRRLLAGGIGALVGLPSSALLAGFSQIGDNGGMSVFAAIGPTTGFLFGPPHG